jgi:RNA polymerase sigma factor (sigma-70 family)
MERSEGPQRPLTHREWCAGHKWSGLGFLLECKDSGRAGDISTVNDVYGVTAPLVDDDPSRARRFETLYLQHYGAILAYAIRRTAARDDAKDVVAEVFTIAWRQIDRLPNEPGERLWLYGTARRILARHHRGRLRRSRLHARLAFEHSDTSTTDPEEPAIDTLRAAIEHLSPRDREAIKLVMWDRLSHGEAAQVLGCSVNALGVRLHRARTRLQNELGVQPVALLIPQPKGNLL